jgi:hypothetical protein
MSQILTHKGGFYSENLENFRLILNELTKLLNQAHVP